MKTRLTTTPQRVANVKKGSTLFLQLLTGTSMRFSSTRAALDDSGGFSLAPTDGIFWCPWSGELYVTGDGYAHIEVIL